MATQLFINVAAPSIESALVRSVTDLTPVAFPELVLGDGRSYELYFVDGNGGYAAFSGDGSYIPSIAIGQCGYPTGGTMVWHFNGQQTPALAYNISPAALQTALQALSSIGAGNCTVSGVAGQYYLVTFTGALGGTAQPAITVDFSGLLPHSTVDMTTIVVGGSGVNCVQLGTLAINPVSFNNTLTPITNGWAGQLSSRTVAMVEAFSAAGGTLSEIFQVTVANANGVRTTYCKVAASVQCTIINPESFAGTDKPLLATQAALNAAVLGLNNFTREALSSVGAGNTNVTRPATSSRHHLARLSVSGAASARTVSLLTTNSPNPGDVILLVVLPDATAGNVLSVYNASTSGTLLSTFTTLGNSAPFFLRFSWSGAAWQLDEDTSAILYKADNLAGLGNTIRAKSNLKDLFASVLNKTADYTVTAADEGKLISCSTAGGSLTITLPAASSVADGFLIAIQKSDGSAFNIFTSPSILTFVNAGELVVLRSNGTSWTILIHYNPVTNPPTAAEVVLNWYFVTALTGGGSADLDGQATAAGAENPYTIVLIFIGGFAQLWRLVNTTAAPGATRVRPFDYDATTNPYQWELVLNTKANSLDGGNTVATGGTLTIAAASANHKAVVSRTGAAGLATISLQQGVATPGSIIALRLTNAATAGQQTKIVYAGTAAVLYDYTSDGSGTDTGFFQVYWTGAAWARFFNIVPVV